MFLKSRFQDSAACSNGAGDSASAIAVLLEVIHNVMNSKHALRNNLIFVFANGVHAFSAPIQTFLNSHPWGKE
jgi:hypothetical protein